MFDRIGTLSRASQTLVQEWGREPTPTELGQELGLPVTQVLEARQIAQYTLSLETPLGADGDLLLGDTLTDQEAHSPFNVASDLERRERTEAALADAYAQGSGDSTATMRDDGWPRANPRGGRADLWAHPRTDSAGGGQSHTEAEVFLHAQAVGNFAGCGTDEAGARGPSRAGAEREPEGT